MTTSTSGLPHDTLLLNRVNLNHLLYFWAVAKTGSVTAAAAALSVSQPAVSEQLRTLEARLGAQLLERTGRGMKLTLAGERVQRHADEVVGICSELVRTLPLQNPPPLRSLVVGTADSVPKIVVRSLLSPLLDANPALRVECREWRVDHLLAELSLHRLDIVLSDTPVDSGPTPRLSSFAAGSSAITICATPSLAKRLRRGYPRSLDGAPFLLPAAGSPLRQTMDRWFALHHIQPRIVVEAEDRSQLHHFAEAGYGAVPVATITAIDLKRQFGLSAIGSPRSVREDYFAVVVERRNQHPSVEQLRAQLSSVLAGRGSGRSRR